MIVKAMRDGDQYENHKENVDFNRPRKNNLSQKSEHTAEFTA